MNEFEKRNQEKDAKRMKDYNDPAYREGMVKLFELARKGEIEVPERGRKRF